jgi:16S rRNA (uracil1498-N3)-methyltransferase
VPVFTERTEVKLDPERTEKRLQHWRGVVAAACEQSGRARVPSLSAPVPLQQWAATSEPGWYLNPKGEDSLQDLPESFASIVLAIGPEGGLAERDLTILKSAGFRGLRLGPRILRTETAGLAAIAAIQAMRGDLG